MASPVSSVVNGAKVNQRSYATISGGLEVPNLIRVQTDAFEWFTTQGLKELLEEISPIEDFPGGRFELSFLAHKFGEPKLSEQECRDNESTYSAPLYVTVELLTKAQGPAEGERKLQELFIGDIPIMTTTGTFIINGAERVVVSQLVRSPGVYFTTDSDSSTGRRLASAKLIPYRGAWMEFETSNRDVISVKVDRKRKSPVSMLLRTMGYSTDEEIVELFEDVDTDTEHQFVKTTIEKDTGVTSHEEALLEFYRRLRPGEPPSLENAKTLLENLFYNPRRYNLGAVGRYKLNRRLGLDTDLDSRTLQPNDIISLLRMMIQINNGEKGPDDIDHLGNRRVKAVGELIQQQVRLGLLRMERVIKERMTTQLDSATTTPAALINIRPVVAAIREFFGGSQLSQFMDQTNPLAELTHKRRLSALGPGGLSRERAGFDVRDVHHSHYGRICPIETPEGPNIGLLGSLATYARTNDYGFIETPYRNVHKEILSTDPDLVGRTVMETVADEDGKTVLNTKGVVSKGIRTRITKLPERRLSVKPYVSSDPNDVVYLAADGEEEVHIAQADSPVDEKGQFLENRIETRRGEAVVMELPESVDLMDVTPMQLVSVSTSLIPFLEHDDANRALMGSNMQRQAVPLVKPESPLVGTGMEGRVARDSGQVVLSRTDGVVTEASGARIVVADSSGEDAEYRLRKFVRSNQGTCINQRPVVRKGDTVAVGSLLADSSSTDGGELALGQNTLVAFMSWEGYNFEDAIIVSEKMVQDDRFTSIHIEKHEVEARDTKLGPEEITRDIPNVGEESLRNLNEEGIIRVGAEIGPGDVLVGKITPKGETELSAEEKLLRAIFGEKARDVKDTSLRVPHGERGKVIEVRVLSKANDDELPPGVNKLVRLWIAQTRKVAEGDKMAGRHGNKGVISKILPQEDLPFLPDGTPVDIILNPIGVPSRMNLGQVLETHLGMAANTLGFRAITPVFDGAPDVGIEDALAQSWLLEKAGAVDPRPVDKNGHSVIDLGVARKWLSAHGFDYETVFNGTPGAAREACLRIWFKEDMGQDVAEMSADDLKREALRLDREKQISAPVLGKSILYDGRSGEPFDQPITVGYIYMMKLSHLVEDKIHARSTGPYSLITQQPLGGKAQFGGQRFGEMEVWALEAYSAAYNLQEMLTVKSDDVVGRVKTYEAIVKGEDVVRPGIPESFHVLLKELQSLGLSVELMYEAPEEPALEDGSTIEEMENELSLAATDGAPSLEVMEGAPATILEGIDGAAAGDEAEGTVATEAVVEAEQSSDDADDTASSTESEAVEEPALAVSADGDEDTAETSQSTAKADGASESDPEMIEQPATEASSNGNEETAEADGPADDPDEAAPPAEPETVEQPAVVASAEQSDESSVSESSAEETESSGSQ